MNYPPSLPDDVKARSFRAGNGELGILLTDASTYLSACRSDHVKLLGWEIWMVDHDWDFDSNALVPAIGYWSGLVPDEGDADPMIISGGGGIADAEEQLARLNLAAELDPSLLPYARVNFTIDG